MTRGKIGRPKAGRDEQRRSGRRDPFAALEAGALGAALSGAGSTVIALCDGEDVAATVAQALAAIATSVGLPGRASIVRPTAAGARVVPGAHQ